MRFDRAHKIAAAAVATLALASCGVSGSEAAQVVNAGAVDAAALTLAAQETAAVTTSKVAVVVQAETADGEQYSVRSEGAFDAENQRGELSTEVAGIAGIEGADAVIDVVYDGDTVYVGSPWLEVFTDGKPWVSVTSAKLADAVASLDGAIQSDPTAALEFLEGAGGPVRELGTEDVAGVSTRHLGVDIDVTRLMAEADPERAERLQQRLDELGVSGDGLDAVPAEVWLDDDGYVRRFSMTVEGGQVAPGIEEAQGVEVTQTVELSAFGEPVEIVVPAADEVSQLDLGSLLGD